MPGRVVREGLSNAGSRWTAAEQQLKWLLGAHSLWSSRESWATRPWLQLQTGEKDGAAASCRAEKSRQELGSPIRGIVAGV